MVEVAADGPTTKADCLNHLYDALVEYELANDCEAKAVVLHDAEDVVHRYELRIFDGLIDRAASCTKDSRCSDTRPTRKDRPKKNVQAWKFSTCIVTAGAVPPGP